MGHKRFSGRLLLYLIAFEVANNKAQQDNGAPSWLWPFGDMIPLVTVGLLLTVCSSLKSHAIPSGDYDQGQRGLNDQCIFFSDGFTILLENKRHGSKIDIYTCHLISIATKHLGPKNLRTLKKSQQYSNVIRMLNFLVTICQKEVKCSMFRATIYHGAYTSWKQSEAKKNSCKTQRMKV